jgi:hypothetical protein
VVEVDSSHACVNIIVVNLELELLGLLPGEVLVGEVAVLGGCVVDRVGEVQLLDNDTRTEVKVLVDNLNKLLGGLVRGAVCLNEEGQRLSYTDGVGKLDQCAASQLGVDERLGDPAGKVSGRTVDLGVVLSGESTTTVGTPATVGVDNNLTASETGITLGSTNDEQTRGLDVVLDVVVKVLGGDDLLDDLLLDLLAELLGGDVLAVLSRDNNGVDTEGNDGTVVVSVLNGDLGLGVGSQPRQGAITAGSSHGRVELVREEEGQRQELRGLVGSIAEHDTLVTGTELLESVLVVEALSDVGRLLLDSDQNITGLVIETLVGGVVADVLDGIADDLLVVEVGLGGNLTKDHDHAGLGGSLAGDLGERVFLEAGIEDGIGDLIAANLLAVSSGRICRRVGGVQGGCSTSCTHADSTGSTVDEVGRWGRGE